VVVAPARGSRPGASTPRVEDETAQERASCPFCEGRETRTPPETLALGRGDDDADGPGWTVRVVPNLYPAFERQEVVVHSPRHVRSFADLRGAELDAVAEAWRRRAEAARGEGFGYVHALVNEGRAAGASLAHSHSQLIWLREPPPAVVAEQSGTPLAELLAEERSAGERVVVETEALALLAARAGRAPYELLIAPLQAAAATAFAGGLLPESLRLLREAVRRLRRLEGPLPWNAWLHDGPAWHLHVLPRLSVEAGVELGAGISVNTLAPEEAAAALRRAAA
jgi:UDPglucose--hexose-1-phosphate uridylyltransferase